MTLMREIRDHKSDVMFKNHTIDGEKIFKIVQ